MLRAFFSGEPCKEGVIQERKRKGLSKDVVSAVACPRTLWGINCTTGLSSSKQGHQAAVLLPLSALGCGLLPFEPNLWSRQLSPGEVNSPEKGADESAMPPGEGSACLIKGLWAGLHSTTASSKPLVTSPSRGAPPSLPSRLALQDFASGSWPSSELVQF